jgi:hypothetical protein
MLGRRGGRFGGQAMNAVEHIVTLAERASVSPTALSRAYGEPPPTRPAALGALVLLTTTCRSSDPRAKIADPAWAARRLARSASYERRGYLDLLRRVRYARSAENFPGVAHQIEEREEQQLRAVLERVRVVDVRAPFPCDPRRIVDAVRPLL